jgi:methylenetetrahydrofolate--tRNA-(uracil-5-)-methyltransferase
MKPVGLTNCAILLLVKAHAIVQLRQDNALGTLFIVAPEFRRKHGPSSRSSA